MVCFVILSVSVFAGHFSIPGSPWVRGSHPNSCYVISSGQNAADVWRHGDVQQMKPHPLIIFWRLILLSRYYRNNIGLSEGSVPTLVCNVMSFKNPFFDQSRNYSNVTFCKKESTIWSSVRSAYNVLCEACMKLWLKHRCGALSEAYMKHWVKHTRDEAYTKHWLNAVETTYNLLFLTSSISSCFLDLHQTL